METNECGKISVIMGVYNCATTLPAAIESILNQTYSDWELIICDDCSTDDTYAVAEQYAKQYPEKIILIRNEKNMRLAYSLNHCLKYATGEYVARMDGDDLSCPDRFEKQIKYLKEHPEIQLVGTAMQRFNEEGTGIIDYAVEKPDKYSLHRRVPFHHATIMTYKNVYDALEGYTVADRTKRAQDYDLWFRFFAKGFNGDSLSEALYMVREDKAAIRRRTFSVRWSVFQTTIYGYNLLHYPKTWLIEEFFRVVFKSLTPYFIVDAYRKWQNKHPKRT